MLHVAGCVIITDQQILLLHKINPARYELPGGKLENGETAEDAAKREVQEELLCEVQIIKKLNEIEFEEDDQIIHYTRFLAMIKKGQQPRIGEKEKFDDVRFVHICDIPAHNSITAKRASSGRDSLRIRSNMPPLADPVW